MPKVFFIGFFQLCLISSAQISHASGQEFSASIKQPFNSSTLIAALDIRQQDGQLFRKQLDLGLRMPVSYFGEGWSFGAHYRSISTPSGSSGWTLEKRPYMQLQKVFLSTKNGVIPALKWTIRNRQEFRFRQQKKDSKRYRLKLTAKSKQLIFNTRPFIATEYYYDFLKDKVNKNRLELGLEFAKTHGVKPSVYYKYTSSYKNKQWQAYSAVVIKLSF